MKFFKNLKSNLDNTMREIVDIKYNLHNARCRISDLEVENRNLNTAIKSLCGGRTLEEMVILGINTETMNYFYTLKSAIEKHSGKHK